MNIGKPVKTVWIPLPDEAPKAIPVENWPKQKPAEAPIESPGWPIKEPAKQE